MANRMKRKTVAKQTVEILERGTYVNEYGSEVSIAKALERAVDSTRHYAPADFDEISAQRDQIMSTADETEGCRFEVTNTTTLAAARKLLNQDPAKRVLCLNFASAKNPGGGFLGGSQAQEESLARASGLYASIHPVREYYDTNRNCGTCLYTDHMIYSPDVPVFRDDRDVLLQSPYNVSFITSPAVNAGALANKNPEQVNQIESVMRRRIERVLSLAVVHRHRTLVLGAWGCGVFRNDPEDIAAWFYASLCENLSLQNAFDEVVFAVLDNAQALGTLRPFESRFGQTQTVHE